MAPLHRSEDLEVFGIVWNGLSNRRTWRSAPGAQRPSVRTCRISEPPSGGSLGLEWFGQMDVAR